MRYTVFCVLLILLTISASAQELHENRAVITPESASQLELVGTIGYGIIDSVAWSPDGHTVAVGSSLGITFYNAELFEHAPYQRIPIPERYVISVAYSPDGRYLASASNTFSYPETTPVMLRLWDTQNHQMIAEWSATTDRYFDVTLAYNPDGTQLALHYDGEAELWDIQDVANIQRLDNQNWTTLSISWFAPDGFVYEPYMQNLTFSRNGDKAVYGVHLLTLIDVASGETLLEVDTDEYPAYFEHYYFSSDGRILYGTGRSEYCGGQVVGWDVVTGEKFLEVDHCAKAFAVHPTRHQIVFAGLWSELEHWIAGDGEPQSVVGRFAGQNIYYKVAFSVDGNTIAARHGDIVELWNSENLTIQQYIFPIPSHDPTYQHTAIQDFALSPDGNYIVLAQSDHTLYLLERETLQPIATLNLHESEYQFGSSVAFSPNGQYLVTIANPPHVHPAMLFWDFETLKRGGNFSLGDAIARVDYFNLDGRVNDIEFSTDSEFMIVNGFGIEVWGVDSIIEAGHIELESGLKETTITAIEGSYYPSAFQTQNQWLAVGTNDCDIAVYQLVSLERLTCINDHPYPPYTAAFSPLQPIIVTGTYAGYEEGEITDFAVRIFNAETGILLQEIPQKEDVMDVAFSPDGTFIAAAGGGWVCNGCVPSGFINLWAVGN
jgi:WD40 repeat protein